MKELFTSIIIFLLPNVVAIPFLNWLGHKVHPSAKIGFSWIKCQKLYLDKNTRIGHFNLISVNKLMLREKAFIKSFNRINGSLNILMRSEAAIANNNSIYRGRAPICLGLATLKLGRLAQIVSKHHLDCTRSIEIGDYSTIGGMGTQFWTHGFFHARTGRNRIRVDGQIKIGHNVYVGSRCIFNPGISIAEGIFIGGNVCVSKSLYRPGMYISQPLRYIDRTMEQIEAKLPKAEQYTIASVYEKTIA